MQNSIANRWLSQFLNTAADHLQEDAPERLRPTQDETTGDARAADLTTDAGQAWSQIKKQEPEALTPLEMALTLVDRAAPLPVSQVRIYLLY